MQGAIKMVFVDDNDRETTEYVILPIYEFRNSGAVFSIEDPDMNGAHLLDAESIRVNWNGWVGELISPDSIIPTVPEGIEVY
jgi:hypothetical protein